MKNFSVNNTGTIFLRLLYSTLLHVSTAYGDHRSLTLMAQYLEKLFVLEALFDFSLCQCVYVYALRGFLEKFL